MSIFYLLIKKLAGGGYNSMLEIPEQLRNSGIKQIDENNSNKTTNCDHLLYQMSLCYYLL